MGKLFDDFKILCSDSDSILKNGGKLFKGGYYSRRDIIQGGYYLRGDTY
jgi:hypothetical protein